jgi:transcriptional regulator with XRE-family HTH domain
MTRIKELRLQRKLTQIELSKLSGVPQNQISRFEKGQSMNEEYIAIFCKIFKVTSDYFIFITDKNEKEKHL